MAGQRGERLDASAAKVRRVSTFTKDSKHFVFEACVSYFKDISGETRIDLLNSEKKGGLGSFRLLCSPWMSNLHTTDGSLLPRVPVKIPHDKV